MKKLKFIIIAVIILLATSTVTYFINEKSPEEVIKTVKSSEDISRIEIIAEEQLFSYYSKDIVDFNTNTITQTIIKGDDEKEKIIKFSDEDKKNFVSQANNYGFFDWKEIYESTINGDNDSAVYSIYITYNDNSEQKIFFQIPDTPATFKAMREVFYETFGSYIL